MSDRITIIPATREGRLKFEIYIDREYIGYERSEERAHERAESELVITDDFQGMYQRRLEQRRNWCD